MKPLFIFFQSIKKLNETNTIYRNDQNQAYDERLNLSMLCIFHLLVSFFPYITTDYRFYKSFVDHLPKQSTQ